MQKMISLSGAFLALAAVGCSPSQDGNSADNITDIRAQSDADVQSVGWEVSRAFDPLTDQKSVTAQRTFQSGPFSVNVAISCTAEGRPRYEFSTFMGDEAAPLDWKQTPNSPFFSRSFTYQLRVDDAPPLKAYALDNRYGNVFSFNGAFLESDAKNVISATRLVLRFPLQQGDATVAIDQQDPAVQEALAQCPQEVQEVIPSPTPTPTPSPVERPTTSVFGPASDAEGREVNLTDVIDQ